MKDTRDRKLDISVLFVEDEIITRDKITSMLGREVRDLYLAENGLEGLELFKSHRPDVIITDVKMPVMDGLEMAQAIKAMDSHVPIIVITAHGEAGFLMSAIEIGIDSYMLKPLDMSRLGDKLKAISSNIHLAEELRLKNRLLEEYKKAVDESNIVCKTDHNGIIVYVNDALCIALGYSKKELTGKSFDYLLHSNIQESVLRSLERTIRSKKVWKGIMEYRKKDGNSYFADLTTVPLLDNDNNIMEFIYIGHNVSELVDFTKWLKQLSNTDNLTQIYNRMAFNDFIEAETMRAKRYKTELSILIFDIDHFKNINDTHGHLVGDEVLRTLAKLVTKTIRTIDIFARWGGEEFVILTPETGIQAAKDLAERIRIEVGEHNFDIAEKITVSFGVTSLMESDQTDTFIKRADDALYTAKKEGRNRVVTG